MAKKPTQTDDLPPAMDYAQHNATYQGFMGMLKWSIIAMVFIVLALYCFIEAQQPLLGGLLLLAIPVLVIGSTVMGSRRT